MLKLFGPSVVFPLIWVVGLIWALITLRKHPAASALAAAAFVIFIGVEFVWFTVIWLKKDTEAAFDTRIWILDASARGVAWICLLIALFARRPMPRAVTALRPDPIDDVLPTAGSVPDVRLRRSQ